MTKTGIVAGETYARQVKSWSFLILVLSPFLFILLSFGVGYLSASTSQARNTIAVVANDSNLRQEFIQSNTLQTTGKHATLPTAKQALQQNKIQGYLVLKTENNQIQVTYHGTKQLESSAKQALQQFVIQKQQHLNQQAANLTSRQLHQLNQLPQIQEKVEKGESTTDLAKLVSFWVLLFLMYFILVTYTSTTAQEIASEKGTKIMEIIFSSTTARKYFYGKMLGVFGVIVTQIAIYLVGGFALYGLAPHLAITKTLFQQYRDLIDQVLKNFFSVNLLYVLLGVVIFTILAALSGALVTRPEDATKAAQPALYLVMLGFFGALTLNKQAELLVVKILSYVPFLSSFFMPLRVIDGSVSGLEVLGSLIILVLSIAGLTYYVGGIYSGLMLQTDNVGFWKSFKRGIQIR
ncbi:ABC transporter permease [Loigolactobacillus backii]|uniref:ABC transporter permease n=1 Tax=Loigolactobacillus backii TaxID=375175 RepID=A0A192H164_9LACO|nr:ABC transporter permease [Loigolactobacillus backii]ANK62023.1 ABC transporter permease [Loigolactobacillus backii]ANK65356.1 ABC transporter permease [Loigolactobacillus backii]ANK67908.1 ABC transporter permease [Loigolactobacillus backii]ANK68783.1 ABC transporter permease [Loigolactobacillus backii]MDA5386788.1 ABC transporter permease [Loigolactobacillus backii]